MIPEQYRTSIMVGERIQKQLDVMFPSKPLATIAKKNQLKITYREMCENFNQCKLNRLQRQDNEKIAYIRSQSGSTQRIVFTDHNNKYEKTTPNSPSQSPRENTSNNIKKYDHSNQRIHGKQYFEKTRLKKPAKIQSNDFKLETDYFQNILKTETSGLATNEMNLTANLNKTFLSTTKYEMEKLSSLTTQRDTKQQNQKIKQLTFGDQNIYPTTQIAASPKSNGSSNLENSSQYKNQLIKMTQQLDELKSNRVYSNLVDPNNENNTHFATVLSNSKQNMEEIRALDGASFLPVKNQHTNQQSIRYNTENFMPYKQKLEYQKQRDFLVEWQQEQSAITNQERAEIGAKIDQRKQMISLTPCPGMGNSNNYNLKDFENLVSTPQQYYVPQMINMTVGGVEQSINQLLNEESKNLRNQLNIPNSNNQESIQNLHNAVEYINQYNYNNGAAEVQLNNNNPNLSTHHTNVNSNNDVFHNYLNNQNLHQNVVDLSVLSSYQPNSSKKQQRSVSNPYGTLSKLDDQFNGQKSESPYAFNTLKDYIKQQSHMKAHHINNNNAKNPLPVIFSINSNQRTTITKPTKFSQMTNMIQDENQLNERYRYMGDIQMNFTPIPSSRETTPLRKLNLTANNSPITEPKVAYTRSSIEKQKYVNLCIDSVRNSTKFDENTLTEQMIEKNFLDQSQNQNFLFKIQNKPEIYRIPNFGYQQENNYFELAPCKINATQIKEKLLENQKYHF